MSIEPIVRFDDLAAALGVSKATIRRWVAAGWFPPPVRVNRRVLLWRVADLDAWFASHTPADTPAAVAAEAPGVADIGTP